MPPTQSVWALSETAGGVLTVSKGLLEAASSDNVQPLALLSTEAFGTVLPISPETRTKIETLANRGYTSHVLNFVKATVGYKKNDCVWQLAQSDGGIRFLCFAATLYTMGNSEAALRLDQLLQKTQKGAMRRPTLHHLQALIDVLEPKLKISDFAAGIAADEQWFRSVMNALPDTVRKTLSFDVAQVPPERAFIELILAMSESSRVGEESDLMVKVRPYHLPWLLAFLKWSLGGSPRIILPDGKSLIDADGSTVILQLLQKPKAPRPGNKRSYQQISEENSKEFQVSLFRRVGGFSHLVFENVTGSPGRAWGGLLGVRDWITYKLESMFEKFPQLSADQGLAFSVGQALYFMIAELPDSLLLSENAVYSKIEERLCKESIKAFPSKEARIELASHLLGERLQLQHNLRDEDESLRPDKLAKILQACDRCKSLSLKRPTGGRPELKKFGGSLPCAVNDFLEDVSSLGSSLLTLSLFGGVADLESLPLLQSGRLFDPNQMHRPLYHHFAKRQILHRDSFPLLINVGWQAIMHGRCKFLACSPNAVFNYARELLGHSKTESTLIVSSAGGQVIYPLFYEAENFIEEGYLRMSSMQGQLIHEDMKFSCVECALADEMSKNLPDDGSTNTAMEVDVESNPSDDGSVFEQSPTENAPIDEDGVQDQSGVEITDGSSATPDREDTRMHEPLAAAAHLKVEVGTDFTSPEPKPDERTQLQWTVTVTGTRLLARVSIPGESNTVFAWSLIDSLSRCVLTNSCSHRKSRTAGPLGRSFLLSNSLTEPLDPEGPKHVIDAGRKFYNQQLALESQEDGWPLIVNNGSCIRCALEKCQTLDLKIVVS